MSSQTTATGSESPTQTTTEKDVEQGPTTHERLSLWQHLKTDVDPAECTGPLAAFCFMTGFIDAISFSAIFVWCGFQTGNFAQLALALARLWESSPSGQGHDTSFHIADRQALTSLLTFNLGAFLGRYGDRVGPHKRIWLVGATFVQVLFTAAAAILIWRSNQGSIAAVRGDPSWSNALTYVGVAFMSASLGLQGILGKRLNTQFTTTIVLTTVWVELVTDPRLFNLRQKVITRDHKLIAAIALFAGAFVARAILASAGAAAALGVGAGVRLLIALSWIVVPGKKPKQP
ncbi:hypothetical protein C8F01DRAFT_1157135 [Mycena amicta]|nr:hypothetical protein C8F01DRAFT_1157135 [Mycena amicta]